MMRISEILFSSILFSSIFIMYSSISTSVSASSLFLPLCPLRCRRQGKDREAKCGCFWLKGFKKKSQIWSNFDNHVPHPFWKLVTSLLCKNSKLGQCEECKYFKAGWFYLFFYMSIFCLSFSHYKKWYYRYLHVYQGADQDGCWLLLSHQTIVGSVNFSLSFPATYTFFHVPPPCLHSPTAIIQGLFFHHSCSFQLVPSAHQFLIFNKENFTHFNFQTTRLYILG